MSANPFKIHGNVYGNFEVAKANTHVVDINFNQYSLKWREIEGEEVLTLDEILQQVAKIKRLPPMGIPFIRVHYSMGLWGVIFEVGNYPKLGKQWIVYGVTKGYA